MEFQSGGKRRRIANQHFVALYRPSDGRIVHLHMVHVLEGAKEVSREQAEAEAREKAKGAGHDVGELEVLYATELPPGSGYRVDLEKRKLVAIDRPKSVRSRPE